MTDVNISRASILELANAITTQLKSTGHGDYGSKKQATRVFADDDKSVKQKADKYRLEQKTLTLYDLYNKRLVEAGNSVAKATNIFQTSSQVLNQSLAKHASINKEFEKSLVDSINEQLKHRDALLKGLRVASLEEVMAMKHVEEAATALSRSFDGSAADVTHAFEQASEIWHDLNKEGIKNFDGLFNKMFSVASSSGDVATKQKELARLMKALSGTVVGASKNLDNLSAQFNEKSKTLSGAIGDKLKKFGNTLFDTDLQLANLLAQLMRFSHDFRNLMKVGFVRDVGQSVFRPWLDAMRMGVDVKDLAELNANNRQLIGNIGSAAVWTSRMSDLQNRYYESLGDMPEALRLAGASMMTFARSGMSNAASYNLAAKENIEAFSYLHKMIGATAEEYQSGLNSIMQDSNLRWQLISANQAQREEITRGTLMRMKERGAMGMTIEQMVAAEKALRGIAALSPKERFKKAAQLQMMMGVYGIGGGEEAAAIMRKGQQRWTPKEAEQMRASMDNLNTTIAQQTAGTFGGEFAAARMTEMFGMPEFLGPNSQITTALNVGVEIQKGSQEHLKEMSGYLNSINKWVQIAGGVVMSSLSGIALALMALVGGRLLGAGKLLSKGAGAVGKMGGMGKGFIPRVGGGVAGLGLMAASQLAPEGGMMGSILGSNAATGAGLGMTIGSIIPGLGTLAGGAIGGALGGAMDLYDYIKGPGQPGVSSDREVAEAAKVPANIEKSAMSLDSLTQKTQELIDLNRQLLNATVAIYDQSKMNAEDKDRMFNLGSRLGDRKTAFINPTG